MKIPGWVFILIGAIIAITSYFVPHLKFFFYVGVALFAYGIAKLVFSFIVKEEKEDAYVQQAMNEVQELRCKKCSNFIRNFDNFCSYCGMRLK